MKVIESFRKSVAVQLHTYERLQRYGMLGDSYSDVIDYIIDFAESKGMTRDDLVQIKHRRYHQVHK